jgi:hypothetical protein
VLLPSAVGASPPGGNSANQPIYGNIVGSPARDRATLGFDGTSCAVTVEAGLGGGRFGAAVVHEYTIPGLTNRADCPDMGVAVRRHHARVDDLVVTWFNAPSGPAQNVYVLRHISVLSGSAADAFPSIIGSQDFNGDRRGDIWESTDLFDGFTTFLRQGDGFVRGPASFENQTPLPSLAFGHLDDTPGTDIAAGYVARHDQPGLPGSAGSGALVVFGSTGQKVLLEHDPTGQTTYTVAIVDANGDGHHDVRVSGGPGPQRIYLGDGHGHFTLRTTT